jgi:hypothetical protein
MGIATILRLLLRAGKAKKAAKVFRSAKKLSKVPQKSKGAPGVRTAKSKPRKEFDADKAWERQMDEFYGYGPHPTMTHVKNAGMRRPTYKVGSDKWKRQVSDDVREFARKHKLGPMSRRDVDFLNRQDPDSYASRMAVKRLQKWEGLSPEVMRMVKRLKVGERLPARTFKSTAERYAPLRGKKKPTLWDQMRAMSDELDDFPID